MDTPRTKQLKDLRQRRLAYFDAQGPPNTSVERNPHGPTRRDVFSAPMNVMPMPRGVAIKPAKSQMKSPRMSSTGTLQRNSVNPARGSRDDRHSISNLNSSQKSQQIKSPMKQHNVFLENDSSGLETESSIFTGPTETDFTKLDERQRSPKVSENGRREPDALDLRLSLGSSILDQGRKPANQNDLYLSLDSTTVVDKICPSKPRVPPLQDHDLRLSLNSSTAVEQEQYYFKKHFDTDSSFDSSTFVDVPQRHTQNTRIPNQGNKQTQNFYLDQSSDYTEVDSDNLKSFSFNKFLANNEITDLDSSVGSGTTAANTYFNAKIKHEDTDNNTQDEDNKIQVQKSVTFILDDDESSTSNKDTETVTDCEPIFRPPQMSSLQAKHENASPVEVGDTVLSRNIGSVNVNSNQLTGKSSTLRGTGGPSQMQPPSYEQRHQHGVSVFAEELVNRDSKILPEATRQTKPLSKSQGPPLAINGSTSSNEEHTSAQNEYKEGYIRGLRSALGEEKFQEMLETSSELQEILSTLDKIPGGPIPNQQNSVNVQNSQLQDTAYGDSQSTTVVSDVMTDVTGDQMLVNQPAKHDEVDDIFGQIESQLNKSRNLKPDVERNEVNNNTILRQQQRSQQSGYSKGKGGEYKSGKSMEFKPGTQINIMPDFEDIDPAVLGPNLNSPYSYRVERSSQSQPSRPKGVQSSGHSKPKVKKSAFSAEQIYQQAFADAESYLSETQISTEKPEKHYPYRFRETTPQRKSVEKSSHSPFHSRPVGPVPRKNGSETGRSSGPSEIIGTGPPKSLTDYERTSSESATSLSQEDHKKAVRDHHQYHKDTILRQATEHRNKRGYTSSSLDRYFLSLQEINREGSFDPIPEWSDVGPNVRKKENGANQEVKLSQKVFRAICGSTPKSSFTENDISGEYENYFLKLVRNSLRDSSIFLDDKSMDQFLENIHGKSDNVDDFMRNLQQSLDSDRFQELLAGQSIDMGSSTQVQRAATPSKSQSDKANKLRQSQKSELGKSTDYEGETIYTKVTGITDKFDRLHIDRTLVRNELMLDESKRHLLVPGRQTLLESESLGFEGENGQRMVVVCPDCASLNKQYVTWCLECGCVLIGVDPVPLKPKKQSKRSLKKQQENNEKPVSPKTKAEEKNAQMVPRKAHLEVEKSDENGNGSSTSSDQEKGNEVAPVLISSKNQLQKSKELHHSWGKHDSLEDNLPTKGGPVRNVLKPLQQDHVQHAYDILQYGPLSPKVSQSLAPGKGDFSLHLSINSSMDTSVENGNKNKGNFLSTSVSSEFQEVEIFERKLDHDLRRQSRRDADVPTINLEALSDDDRNPVDNATMNDGVPSVIELDDLSTCVDGADVSTLTDVPIHVEPKNQQSYGQSRQDHHEFVERLQSDSRVKRLSGPKTPSVGNTGSRPKSAGKYRTSTSLELKGKGRPASASKVRNSIEAEPYRRRWEKSSTAWNSFAANELSTWSSTSPAKKRPISGKLRKSGGLERASDDRKSGSRPTSAGQKSRPTSAGNQRPSSGSTQHIKTRMSERLAELNPDPIPNRPEVIEAWGAIEHPVAVRPKVPLVQHNVEPISRDVFAHHVSMSPRVAEGRMSLLLCLPDELLLHIFSFLTHEELTQVARTCTQMYRLTQDETLWKHIMIRNKTNLADEHLDDIGRRRPLSICLIQCLGETVTSLGMRNMFRHCSDTLQELNVMGCSRGGLTGESIIFHAAAKCHNLTHVDMSWTNINDTVLVSMSNCSRRLISLNISGCQAVTDEGLISVVKRHGESLRSIEAFGCFNITTKGIKTLGQFCRRLETLNLGQCYKITDASVAQLAPSLERVRHLDFRGCKQVKDNCMRKIVRCCKNLESITLANCPGATDLSLVEVATYLPNIKYVDVSGCKLVTDVGMRSLAHNCYLMEHLDLSSTGVTNKSVCLLASYCSQRLQVLKLNFCKDITENSLVKLARHCKKLRLVHLYGCKNIRNLDRILLENEDLSIEM